MSGLRDIHYALRGFARAPLAVITIVGTVALGLGLVAVVFTFFNAFVFRVDAVRDPHGLFAVQRLPNAGARVWMPFTRPEYEALRADTALFTDVFGSLRGLATRIDGRPANGTLVTGNFFQVLGVSAAHGRTFGPQDEEAGHAVIVLSHRGWTKLFANDVSAVGRRVFVGNVPVEVVGIMPDGFRGLALGAPDYWAPLALAGQLRSSFAGKENAISIDVVGRLRPDVSPQTAVAGLSVWAAGTTSRAAVARPPYFRLRPSRGTVGDDAREPLKVFAPLFIAFGLVLLIGCANVANLLLARGVARQREIGTRLSLGASRGRIVRQLLTESLLLALTAAVCAFALSRLLLETAVRVAIGAMPIEMAEHMNVPVPTADWRVILFLLGGAVLSTALFGLAPAVQAARLERVRTMRGEVARDARPGRARSALIAVQVTAAAVLLICAAVFLRSALTSASDSPGVRTADTVVVDIDNESLRAPILQALAGHPVVAAVAASQPHGLAHAPSTFAEAASTSTRVGLDYRFVSPEYFELLDLAITRGRGFTSAEREPGAGVVVISESAARKLWPAGRSVGEMLRLHPIDRGRGAGTTSSSAVTPMLPIGALAVVGVVRDVRRALEPNAPSNAVVYLPTRSDAAGTVFTLRVHGDPTQAREALVKDLTKVDPALGDIMTMRTMAGLETFILRTAFWITVVVGSLALLLTLSGLFSVLSFLVEQRRKEIGIRMAMGARASNVIRIVLSQSAVPVVVGVVAGGALAAGLATVLMSTGAAATLGQAVRVFDPLAYGASMLCILVACLAAASIPATRAARIDPIETLRHEQAPVQTPGMSRSTRRFRIHRPCRKAARRDCHSRQEKTGGACRERIRVVRTETRST